MTGGSQLMSKQAAHDDHTHKSSAFFVQHNNVCARARVYVGVCGWWWWGGRRHAAVNVVDATPTAVGMLQLGSLTPFMITLRTPYHSHAYTTKVASRCGFGHTQVRLKARTVASVC